MVSDIVHIGTTVNLKRYVYDRAGENCVEHTDNLDSFYDFSLALKTLL